MNTATVVSTLMALAALAGAPAQAQDQPRPGADAALETTTPGDPNRQPLGDPQQVVPPMDEDSATGLRVEGQHPPTTAIGKAVPPMQSTEQKKPLQLEDKQAQTR